MRWGRTAELLSDLPLPLFLLCAHHFLRGASPPSQSEGTRTQLFPIAAPVRSLRDNGLNRESHVCPWFILFLPGSSTGGEGRGRARATPRPALSIQPECAETRAKADPISRPEDRPGARPEARDAARGAESSVGATGGAGLRSVRERRRDRKGFREQSQLGLEVTREREKHRLSRVRLLEQSYYKQVAYKHQGFLSLVLEAGKSETEAPGAASQSGDVWSSWRAVVPLRPLVVVEGVRGLPGVSIPRARIPRRRAPPS